MKTLLVMTVALGALVVGAAPVEAATYYGHTSRAVARDIGCTHFKGNGGGGMVYRTGVCQLRGKRVNVITFKNKEQQRSWNVVARAAFGPRYFWGNGKGALIVARNGNRPAAVLGAHVLPGRVAQGSAQRFALTTASAVDGSPGSDERRPRGQRPRWRRRWSANRADQMS
ncbi:hypothetical protein [Nocardioides sp. T2.26MG-1]|uniref:hypothetical protein n=1 Tax=Nocardioides sp. T2.26MG-1 TaxID=3041166 RepID=UPI0024778DF7|nr:hypothetical protein [Nocardioides sp. T2.26MG-1]CAI9419375.1 hypothetical protein HIDPHFAB_03661 [Nocardioides sp. T2.26MG-1]